MKFGLTTAIRPGTFGRFRRALCVLMLSVLTALGADRAQAQTRPDTSGPARPVHDVIVGVEPYPPLTFIDEADGPSGLAIDLLRTVAKREGWSLRFVPGTFSELLGMLEAREIDLLPTIAYSAERLPLYDFTEQPYISNWGSVFRQRGEPLDSVTDLDGRRIARLTSDIHAAALEQLVDGFDIEVNWLDVGSNGQAIAAVRDGSVDAAIVSRLYGRQLLSDPDVVESGIQINPVGLHFAAPEGLADRHLAAIDRFLSEQKHDERSEYRETVNHWLGGEVTTWRDHGNLAALVASGFVTAALFLFFTVIFRLQLRRRTRELREAGSRLQKVLNGLVDAVLIVDPDGHVRYANETSAAMFGSPVDDLVDKAFALPAVAGEAADVLLSRPDGTWCDAEIRGTSIDYQGEDCVLVSLRDMSERKAAEREIEHGHELLDAVLENIADGVVACDAKGELTLFNRATRELHGLPETPLPPERWADHYDLYMPDGITPMPMTEIPLFRALKGEEVKNAEMVIAPKEATPRRLLASGKAMYDRHGDKIGAVASMHDVTEQAAAQRALQESEERFRRAFESAGHGIALVGLDGRWLDVNAKICEMFGYDREELLAADFQTITHPDDLDEDLDHVQRVIDGEIPSYQMEKRYIRKDGSVMPTMLSVGLVRGEDQKPRHFVSQIVDLSDLKESEEKLIQAQKMEAVGNLTGGIAHDFNNILSVILGNLQLLQRRVKDEPQLTKFATTAVDATRRGADLTRQLLAYSRRQELEAQVLNANEFVANMDTMLRRTLGSHIKIQTDLADDLGRIKADPAQLETAVLNLCINARDAMPDGGKLLIETSNVDLDENYAERYEDAQAGPHVCISVTDSGSGMSDDVREKIFQPFFTTKDVGKGTGLGLSMVYGFVRQSGGHINVYSEPGHGTRLRIYLPRTLDKEAAEEAPAPEDFPTGVGTILVVEDEERVRETATLMLEDLGYDVIGAPDGPSALDRLDSTPGIDLLFTDMVMPGGMNGHELADRARERKPGLPVLLASGYPRDAFAEGRSYPLLQKPYTDQALARAVRDALGTQASAQVNAAVS